MFLTPRGNIGLGWKERMVTVYEEFRGEQGCDEMSLGVLSITSADTAVYQLHPLPPSDGFMLRRQ